MKTTIRYRWRQSGAMDARVLAGAALLVVVAAVVFYLWFVPPAPEPPAPAAPPAPPPATPEERGDSAREVIAELREADDVDYARALDRAREFRAAGRMADAQLLYFFAARGKYAPAAAELGAMYDPLSFSAETSLMDEPDPFQAYKWYRQALESGDTGAGQRLAALKQWAEQAAATGDPEAERLLLQWESVP